MLPPKAQAERNHPTANITTEVLVAGRTRPIMRSYLGHEISAWRENTTLRKYSVDAQGVEVDIKYGVPTRAEKVAL